MAIEYFNQKYLEQHQKGETVKEEQWLVKQIKFVYEEKVSFYIDEYTNLITNKEPFSRKPLQILEKAEQTLNDIEKLVQEKKKSDLSSLLPDLTLNYSDIPQQTKFKRRIDINKKIYDLYMEEFNILQSEL